MREAGGGRGRGNGARRRMSPGVPPPITKSLENVSARSLIQMWQFHFAEYVEKSFNYNSFIDDSRNQY